MQILTPFHIKGLNICRSWYPGAGTLEPITLRHQDNAYLCLVWRDEKLHIKASGMQLNQYLEGNKYLH